MDAINTSYNQPIPAEQVVAQSVAGPSAEPAPQPQSEPPPQETGKGENVDTRA